MITESKMRLLLQKIKTFKMSATEKKRMLRLFQVRGSNEVNKSMTYNSFVLLLKEKNANITDFVVGPKWNRLIFIDVDVEI